MEKYVTVTISGIITQIARPTKIKGYTEGVMEIFFPEDKEMESWSEKKTQAWIKENNERMEAICEFLNKTYKK